jgi:hypothetical protein
MSSRSSILVAAGIAILAFGATDAFARSGMSGHSSMGSMGHSSMGSMGHSSMGSYMGHSPMMGHMDHMGHMGHMDHDFRGFGGHFHHHRHFFVGAFLPYDDDYYDYDYEDCPLVHVRVPTRHGPRWRWVQSCEY